MLPDKPAPGSAADWLRHAKSDLALAVAAVSGEVLYCQLCFHAQQAAEKSIKAVLIHYGIEFQKVHDLDHLMALLPPDVMLPPHAEEVAGLTGYAVALRYPGDYEDATKEEYWEAIQVARAVVAWAEQVIRAKA